MTLRASINGFLLVEYVPHTRALGFEVLIGFREDPGFGPVLTVSKGGDDAEFFTAHFDPANLFLPPMDYSSALELMYSLHIRHRFEQIGHIEYLELRAKALAGMSMLATSYSPISPSPMIVQTTVFHSSDYVRYLKLLQFGCRCDAVPTGVLAVATMNASGDRASRGVIV